MFENVNDVPVGVPHDFSHGLGEWTTNLSYRPSQVILTSYSRDFSKLNTIPPNTVSMRRRGDLPYFADARLRKHDSWTSCRCQIKRRSPTQLSLAPELGCLVYLTHGCVEAIGTRHAHGRMYFELLFSRGFHGNS